MSRKNNVNPDHYKTKGREVPGQGVVQEAHKQRYGTALQEERKAAKRPARRKKR